mmetsp:Transcript_48851/g.116138  ORF Transcript_48851/g.116138 Transcript_48851/m.116138 type:complete len:273 (+) Transcript_48851:53-871(+)
MTAAVMDVAQLAEPFPFRWQEITNEPKVMRSCLHRLHRTMEYEILDTGGFVRLCTERGRVYWMAQNEQEHTTPDWKLHFSIRPAHVPMAWDILSKLFVEHGCDFGMKAVTEDALATWPHKQRGREITVYIFVHDGSFPDGGPMLCHCEPGSEHRFWLGPEFERSQAFWWNFIAEAESALAAAGVESNGGVAAGDLALGGQYASLRNEAFIWGREEDETDDGDMKLVYPPNAAGWNAARHPCPFELASFNPYSLQAMVSHVQCCRRSRKSRQR